MENSTQSAPVKANHRMRRAAIYAVLLIGAFLLGFLPMWVKSLENSRSLSNAENQLDLSGMQNALAFAAISAHRGDYEPARQSASDFFTSLRTVTDGKSGSLLSPTQREELQPLNAQRDGMITLLARSDQASADRLSDLYVSFRKVVHSKGDGGVVESSSSDRVSDPRTTY